MARNVNRFFDRDAFSDITIKFSGRQVKCHRVILCASSDYFEALCGADSSFRERKQKSIELKDDDEPDAVEAMLAYLYSFDYLEKFEKRRYDPGFHLEVLIVAKKYLIPNLERKALDALKAATSRLDVDGVWKFIQYAYDCQGQCAELDKHIAFLKRKFLSKLIMRRDFHEMFLEDAELVQVVEEKLELPIDLTEEGYIRCKCDSSNCLFPLDRSRYCLCCSSHWKKDDLLLQDLEPEVSRKEQRTFRSL